jgi:hypothetical protein
VEGLIKIIAYGFFISVVRLTAFGVKGLKLTYEGWGVAI